MKENSEPKLSENQFAIYRETLDEWMKTEKPYLRKDFCLQDLRAVLPMNRSYISKMINSGYGCNFYRYVAGFRLEEAKRLLKNHPTMQIQEVADLSGFSSTTVFDHIFLREVGMTPSEWVSQQKRK